MPHRFLCGIDLFLKCDPNELYTWQLQKCPLCPSRTPDRSLDRRRDNGRVITIGDFKFNFNESTAGESFSLPAPSRKKEEDGAARSISFKIFIFTPSSAANKTNLDASPQPRLVGESGLERI